MNSNLIFKMYFMLLLMIISSAVTALGQQSRVGKDTLLNSNVIEIIQAYKPKVQQTPKPLWMPQLPPADTTHIPVTYQVPQQNLFYSYTSPALHPLALGKDTILIPFPNYLKIGYGINSSLFLDAGIGGLKTFKNNDAVFHVHHFSQEGNIQYQQTAFSGIEIDDNLHNATNNLHTGLYFERNQYFDYGYDHKLYDYKTDSVQQTYYSGKLVADLNNKPSQNANFDYDPKLIFSIYENDKKNNSSESSLELSAPVNYAIDDNITIHLTVDADAAHFNYSGFHQQDNSFLELLPGINYHKGTLEAHAWLGYAGGHGTSYLLPDMAASMPMKGLPITMYGGLQSTYRQNSFEQLTTENPYMFSYYHIQQMTATQLFLGLKGTSGSHIFYGVRASWWSYNNLPTFLNDTLDQKQFYVLYDKVTAASINGSVKYVVDKTWSADIVADYYKYYSGSQQYVWSTPSSNLKLDFNINPIPKLTITAYGAIASGIYGMNLNHDVVNQSTIVDIGGYGEYCFKPNLSAFLQLNNLLNNKYTYFYGYSAYGLNAYAGIRLKF